MVQVRRYIIAGLVQMSDMWSQYVLTLAVFLSHLAHVVSGSSPQRFQFSLSSECADNQCLSLLHVKVRSRTECAATCGYSSTCAGFSYILAGNCFHVQENCLLTSCPGDVWYVYMKSVSQQPCFNNGTWDEQRRACSCRNGWVGTQCQRMPHRCQELYTSGYTAGMYNIGIDVFKNQSLVAYTQCEIGPTWWRTFIFSSDARGHYNRTWRDYQKGFQDGQWNQWLGLENIYSFNQMGHVTVAFSVAVQGGKFVWEYVYENFHMSDATSGYAFTYSHSFKQTFGSYYLSKDAYLNDVLGFTTGMPFSTFDMDRDNDSENCAALHGAGWWVDTCTTGQPVNPLGLNPKTSPSVSELNKILIPGINISDPTIMDNFQSVFMTFTD